MKKYVPSLNFKIQIANLRQLLQIEQQCILADDLHFKVLTKHTGL